MEALLVGSLLAAALVFGAVMLLAGLAKLVLVLVFLPLKFAFALLLFPFWAARLLLKAIGFLVFLPVVLLGGGVALVVVVLGGLLAVGIPLLLIGGLVAALGMMVKAIVRPVAVGA